MANKKDNSLLLNWLKSSSGKSGLSETHHDQAEASTPKVTDECVPLPEVKLLEASQSSGIESLTPSLTEETLFQREPYQSETDLPPPQIIIGPNSKTRTLTFQHDWYTDYDWLTYIPQKGAVFCHACITAKLQGLFPSTLKLELAFLETGFKNWKKATERFDGHQRGKQHGTAVTKIADSKKISIETKLQEASIMAFKQNREALRIIFTSVRYLARQGIALLGDDEKQGNLIQLLHLRSDNFPFINQWLKRAVNYTSPIIQNEILELFCHSILRKLLAKVLFAKWFSLIADETTDVSTKEQLSICLRYVDENLEAHEDFFGFYEMSSTTGVALVAAIKDVLLRFNLQIENCRGQGYDGASNMSGKYRGVQAQIKELEPRAIYIHCFNHSLNLALQDSIRGIPVMRDTLQYVNDVAVLLGRSAKRLHALEEIAKELEFDKFVTFKALCPTRWTVRVKALLTIINQYPVLLEMLEYLKTSNEKCSVTASGLHRHFEQYEALFAVMLMHEVFQPCETLAKVLQSKSATMNGSIHSAKVLISHLKDLKNHSSFAKFKSKVDENAEKFGLTPYTLPRKRKVPARFKEVISDPLYANSVDDHFQKLYETTLGSLITELESRFTQDGIMDYANLENILTDGNLLEEENEGESRATLLCKYDIKPELFNHQIAMYRKAVTDKGVECNLNSVVDCISSFKSLHPDVRNLLSEVKKIVILLLVIPASTATAERSFSTLKRVKSYLRSTMNQSRLNHLCVINAYKEVCDELEIHELIEEFISRNDTRVAHFGKCSSSE